MAYLDITDLRVEMSGQNAALRREITEGDAATRLEIAKLRLRSMSSFVKLKPNRYSAESAIMYFAW